MAFSKAIGFLGALCPNVERPAVDLHAETSEGEDPDRPGPCLRRRAGRRDVELADEPLDVRNVDLSLERSHQSCILDIHCPAKVAIRSVVLARGQGHAQPMDLTMLLSS